MKIMRIKRLVTILGIILSPLALSGQTGSTPEERRAYLDHLFEHIDFSYVPPPFLLIDYSDHILNFNNYTGLQPADSANCNVALLRLLQTELLDGLVNQSTFSNTLDVDSLINNSSSSSLQIGILCHKYHKIKDNAIASGQLTLNNGQLYYTYTNSGSLVYPYEASRVFAFSPGRSICRQDVSFSFNEDQFFCEEGNSSYGQSGFWDFWIDFGDGSSWKHVQNLNQTFTVHYSSIGTKQLQLMAIRSGYTTLRAYATVTVKSDSELPNHAPSSGGGSGIVPTDTIRVVKNGLRAQAVYKLAPGHTGIMRPFIIVEGLDINDFADSEEGLTTFDNTYPELPQYIKDEYDVFYVDLFDWDADIFDNATLVQSVINAINQRKLWVHSDEKNIIMGQSMGGLVTRVALVDMENSGTAHECRMYISHDAPHYGANVPVGFLYLADMLYSIYGNNTMASKFLYYMYDFVNSNGIFPDGRVFSSFVNKLFKASSIRQMLFRFLLNGSYTSAYHSSFFSALSLKGFPNGEEGIYIENDVISNGGWMWNLDYELLTILHHGLKRDSGIEITSFINNSSDVAVFKIGLVFSLILSGVSGVPHDAIQNASFYDTSMFQGMIDNCDSLSIVDYTHLADSFPFIPTASSIAYGNDWSAMTSLSDYNIDFYSNRYSISTPFQNIYLAPNATEHISINSDIRAWMTNVVSIDIKGPDIIMDSTVQYRCLKATDSTYINNSYITWSSSNPSVASIDANGLVTPHGSGVVTITAEITNPERLIKKKRIIVGLPSFVLETSYAPSWPYGYKVSAVFDNSEEEAFISSLLAEGSIRFQWGIKKGSGTITWHTSTNKYYQLELSEEVAAYVVFCDIVSTSSGNSFFSPIPFVSVTTEQPFLCNIDLVERSYGNYVYFSGPNFSAYYIWGSTVYPRPKLWFSTNPSFLYNENSISYCRAYDNQYNEFCEIDSGYSEITNGITYYHYSCDMFAHNPFDAYFQESTPSVTEYRPVLIRLFSGGTTCIQEVTIPVIIWAH